MASTLHGTINTLASEFAHELLRALRGASLDEIIKETHAGHGTSREGQARRAAPAGRRRGRLARRSPSELAKMVEKLVAVVRASKKGIGAEALRTALMVERRELPRPLAMALKTKKIRKRGKKRATTYFAA